MLPYLLRPPQDILRNGNPEVGRTQLLVWPSLSPQYVSHGGHFPLPQALYGERYMLGLYSQTEMLPSCGRFLGKHFTVTGIG